MAEAVVEGRGGVDDGEENTAGKRDVDEAWEGRETEEDLEDEVIVEVNCCGGLMGHHRWEAPPSRRQIAENE
jgi:hypothetical protein